MTALETLTPADEAEACAMVAEARAAGRTLAIAGAGSKSAVGQPVAADAAITSTGLSGIVEYNPEELVIVAKAGTPVSEIETALAANNQALMFEPADWSRLLGSNAGQTIGGIAATNMSGPRRIIAGAARDSLLGVRFINGRGEAIKNGGRVMKNVTGLDLVKLLAGSWGTLGLITETAFKVLPRAETETTLVIDGADGDEAARLMAAAMGTSAEVSGAAHLPANVSGAVLGDAFAGRGATLLRLEGFAEAIAERMARLKPQLGTDREIAELDGAASSAAWEAIRDVHPFADGGDGPVWRLSVPPMAGHAVAAQILDGAGGQAFFDWQGGLVWLRLDGDDARAELVRDAVAAHPGGHALLVRASADLRARIDVFHPEPAPVAALSERIRASIDPDGVFNSGRRAFNSGRDAA
ncbi:MAG: FAD-binding protein [Phyllobacteriaceae bacterium]|jgi:glycolate oxidase FAD binding subunit|nr:FAD-binding protein [Phyllobacteriaceae bacterium]